MQAAQAQKLERLLVRAAQAGDRSAFDQLVRGHFERIYSILFRLVGNHEDAEDLAQESFVRAYRALAFYKEEGPFGAWLTRIAVHLARDHYRRRGRRPLMASFQQFGRGEGSERVLEPEARASGPSQAASQKELAQRVRDAIEELPYQLRVAIVLRVLEGLPYEEIATATGLRAGTVRTQVMKARRLLARAFGRDGEGGAK